MYIVPVTQTPRIAPARNRPRRAPENDFVGKHVHMIGIGGCGMRGAAGLLLRCGAVVTGSDRESFEGRGEMVRSGMTINVGQKASNVPDGADLVVVSSAVPETNEELMAARSRGCRVIRYSELLGELMQVRKGVAVAGTHGKSTSAALCAHLFRVSGLDPSFVIGANVPQLGGGSGVGMGEHMIVEACEFGRSFLDMRPASAAILNVEEDHLDCYRDLSDIVEAFGAFARSVPADGLIVANHEDRNVSAAIAGVSARVETFGFEADATWWATNMSVDQGRYSFDVLYESQRLFRTSLVIAGRHNVSNALAAVALAWNAGASRELIAEALRTFEGVDRRMSLRAEAGGVTVVDDYAHHPTEIRVTLAALRDRYAPKRVWVVFQPHQHSRTRILMDDFADSFGDADEVIIPDIYGSRDTELEIKRTGSHLLVSQIQENGGAVRYVPRLSDIAVILDREMSPGDLIVTMGAGDVWKLADELVERLQRAG